MSTEENIVQAAKEAVTAPFPKPPSLHQQASAHELKERLEWGEPALTILDVRDRETFNSGHIMGAMTMPMETLVEMASGIAKERDIYVYGASDEETTQAAAALREAGFVHVAELRGGLAAWKEIAGSTEGQDEKAELTAGAFNVVSRISQHTQTQSKNV